MGINFGDIFDKRKKAYLIMKKIQVVSTQKFQFCLILTVVLKTVALRKNILVELVSYRGKLVVS